MFSEESYKEQGLNRNEELFKVFLFLCGIGFIMSIAFGGILN